MKVNSPEIEFEIGMKVYRPIIDMGEPIVVSDIIARVTPKTVSFKSGNLTTNYCTKLSKRDHMLKHLTTSLEEAYQRMELDLQSSIESLKKKISEAEQNLEYVKSRSTCAGCSRLTTGRHQYWGRTYCKTCYQKEIQDTEYPEEILG